MKLRRPAFVKCSFAAALLFWSRAAAPHEYYLMPQDFTPPAGAAFGVEHRLGQDFKGNQIPYISRWTVRSELRRGESSRTLKGTDGDRPAMSVPGLPASTVTLAYESNIDFLDFTEPAKLDAYLEKEGLTDVLALYRAGTLPPPSPEAPVKEAYARFARALVHVGADKAGTDRPAALTAELVAEANPLTLEPGAPLPVRFLWKGAPLAGITVKVFPRQGAPYAERLVTDAQGRVAVPDLGPGPYLLNAIRMGEPESAEAKERGARWQSWWASLTYVRVADEVRAAD